MSKKVFLVGPGYIGRTVIDELLNDKTNYEITALVRRQEAADELSNLGVQHVLGSLEDKDVISKQTTRTDIVIHTATADDLPSVQAVLEGIKQRASEGKETIYIHTSGTSELSDTSKSAYKADTIFSDNKPEDIDALPDSASHRLIDLEILNARKELGNKAKIYIVLPPLIFGVVKSFGRLSIQVPTMTRFALKHKYAGHVGAGKAVWSTVHVSDLARGYVLILHWAESQGSPPKNPYFFCENGDEISWGEIAGMIGENLKPSGRVDDSTPREAPEENYGDFFGPYSAVVIGANSRSRAQRLRELGWKPREKDVREAFKTEELPLLLEERGEFRGYEKAAASGASD